MSGIHPAVQALEMTSWEKEKFDDLLRAVKPQIEMIKAQLKMIGLELKKVEDSYSLDFMCDMQDYLQDLIIENL